MAGISSSNSRPGLLQEFAGSALQGAGQSLGQQAGKGLGALAGMGAEKLGSYFSKPDNSAVQFWITQGYSPEEAQYLAASPPQIQQQAMKQKAGQKRAEAVGAALGGIRGVPQGAAKGGEESFDADLVAAAQAGASEQDLFNLLKAKQGQQKIGHQEEKLDIARHKTTAPTMKQYSDEYKAAKKGEHTIERMRELEKEDLAGPGEAKFLETIGEVPFVGKFIKAFTGPLALNPASQEFQKLQQEFLGEMRSLFGGNIPVAEMEQFMKSIPTLMNTKEGRKRIYKNLEYGYKIKKQAFKLAQEIKKENGGRTPLDIDEQVTARLGKKIKTIASKFDFGAEKPAKKSEPVAKAAQQPAPVPKQPFVPYENSMRNTLEDLF